MKFQLKQQSSDTEQSSFLSSNSDYTIYQLYDLATLLSVPEFPHFKEWVQ